MSNKEISNKEKLIKLVEENLMDVLEAAAQVYNKKEYLDSIKTLTDTYDVIVNSSNRPISLKNIKIPVPSLKEIYERRLDSERSETIDKGRASRAADCE